MQSFFFHIQTYFTLQIESLYSLYFNSKMLVENDDFQLGIPLLDIYYASIRWQSQ